MGRPDSFRRKRQCLPAADPPVLRTQPRRFRTDLLHADLHREIPLLCQSDRKQTEIRLFHYRNKRLPGNKRKQPAGGIKLSKNASNKINKRISFIIITIILIREIPLAKSITSFLYTLLCSKYFPGNFLQTVPQEGHYRLATVQIPPFI